MADGLDDGDFLHNCWEFGRLSVAPTKLVPRQNPKTKLFDANALELYLVTVAAIDPSVLCSLFSFLLNLVHSHYIPRSSSCLPGIYTEFHGL